AEAATTDRDGSAGARGPGATYLLGLSRSRERAAALAERLDRSVAGLWRTRVQRLLTSPSLPVSAAYLVDRPGVEAFRSAIANLDAAVADAQIVCTGPWPAYSFTGAPGP
ncbi:MAG: GvpL/GvpF family gas vesicle protein, partial [Actinomycetota bacterium]|nr:GvpL/GvpF family gas vesicle protein [Actinomycetota bacterium]